MPDGTARGYLWKEAKNGPVTVAWIYRLNQWPSIYTRPLCQEWWGSGDIAKAPMRALEPASETPQLRNRYVALSDEVQEVLEGQGWGTPGGLRPREIPAIAEPSQLEAPEQAVLRLISSSRALLVL
jgi:hypothetical protein